MPSGELTGRARPRRGGGLESRLRTQIHMLRPSATKMCHSGWSEKNMGLLPSLHDGRFSSTIQKVMASIISDVPSRSMRFI